MEEERKRKKSYCIAFDLGSGLIREEPENVTGHYPATKVRFVPVTLCGGADSPSNNPRLQRRKD